MTESGIAELRRLLRGKHVLYRRLMDACVRWEIYEYCPTEHMYNLTPAELRMFLTFVLYAETDK